MRQAKLQHSSKIAPIIAHCEDILQMRFIQETYHKIHIQCVHNIAESKLTKEEVEKDMTAKLNAKFKHPFEIEYEWMDSIPPDKNGKLRMIVCKVQDLGGIQWLGKIKMLL